MTDTVDIIDSGITIGRNLDKEEFVNRVSLDERALKTANQLAIMMGGRKVDAPPTREEAGKMFDNAVAGLDVNLTWPYADATPAKVVKSTSEPEKRVVMFDKRGILTPNGMALNDYVHGVVIMEGKTVEEAKARIDLVIAGETVRVNWPSETNPYYLKAA